MTQRYAVTFSPNYSFVTDTRTGRMIGKTMSHQDATKFAARLNLESMIADLDAEEAPISTDTQPSVEYDDPNFLNV